MTGQLIITRMISCVLLCASFASAFTAPYVRSKQPSSTVFPVSEEGRSNEELLLLDSLAGNLARFRPRLYRVASSEWQTSTSDSYSLWLQDLVAKHGLKADDELLKQPAQAIVEHFKAEVKGYLRCSAGDKSTSAALTLAASGEGLLVACSDGLASMLEAASVALFRDLRGKAVSDVLSEALPSLSQRVFVFQDPSKSQFLGEYSIFARAASMKWDSELGTQQTLLSRTEEVGVALGWGPENTYVSNLGEHGIYVHASDYNKNLAVLSNPPESAVQARPHGLKAAAAAARHTVSFLISDGDNYQWTLGPWSTDQKWFGSSQRGSVPVGWTYPPSMADVAPTVLQNISGRCTALDELVSGPAGFGYTYPSTWPESLRTDYTGLTFGGMHRAGMRLMNVIGKGDDAPAEHDIGPLLSNDQVDAVLYYPFGDGYAGLKGQLWWMNGKPVVSGRYSLWGNGTSGEMLDVAAMIEKLKAMPQDPHSAEGYSLIPVHAWSHSYADIATVAEALRKEGGFDVVLPSELVRRIKANLKPPGPSEMLSLLLV